jgi:hypothetical protein
VIDQFASAAKYSRKAVFLGNKWRKVEKTGIITPVRTVESLMSGHFL